jgi:ubiquinone/menaquinone biosynthesis C-methylase UbiE
MREATFRGRLCAQVLDGLMPGAPVVDVGCGTGTLAIALAALGAAVIGVDGDPEVLALARAKPGADAVQWRKGLATPLPLAGATIDRVVMSLLLHHLDAGAKRAALAEAVRVLRPGGRLHVADWGQPRDPLMRGAAWALERVDGPQGLREHLAGDVPVLLADAGFVAVAVHDRLRTGWGSLELLSGLRPA